MQAPNSDTVQSSVGTHHFQLRGRSVTRFNDAIHPPFLRVLLQVMLKPALTQNCYVNLAFTHQIKTGFEPVVGTDKSNRAEKLFKREAAPYHLSHRNQITGKASGT